MASGCVPGEVEEGGQDPDEEAVKVYLIRFIADLPLSWYTGSMIECLEPIISISITLYHHKRHCNCACKNDILSIISSFFVFSL